MGLAAVAFSSVLAVPAIAGASPLAAATPDWLTTVNAFRAMAGLAAVTHDPALSAPAADHSCYMLANGISHSETVGKPGYTPAGDASGRSSNVAVSSRYQETARSHIELWMTGPFHAIGILRAGLSSVGFGTCDLAGTPTVWHSAATLDVLHGLGSVAVPTTPTVFPGNGTTTSLDHFIAETPNPLDFCGWTGQPAGLPIVALMPEAVSTDPTAAVSGPSGALETCVLSSKNTTGVAKTLLAGDNAVIVIPRDRLAPGVHRVSVTTSARTVTWSFTVDQAAVPDATVGRAIAPVSVVQPGALTAPTTGATPSPTGATPTTTPQGVPAGQPGPATSGSEGVTLHPLTPARIVDTRANVGSTSLVGTLTKRIQVTGRGGVPAGAAAISANFTVTNAAAGGYLTAWNCSVDRPVASMLNFLRGDTVPNGASVPLDATGGVCVYASSSADLLLDVSGYYASGDGGRFVAVTPARLMDSRAGLGSPSRLASDSVVSLRVTDIAGVPSGASAVALNVTSVDPSAAGFVSVYPCDGQRPSVSSLNPVPGVARPNVVITPVGADGRICIYTLTDVDLVVDITGYFLVTASSAFTSTTPFRFTDTRDRSRVELNGGTAGEPLAANQVLVVQVAGERGVPTDARAISANFTVLGAGAPGYLTAWPCEQRPATSTVNYVVGNAVANGAQMPLSATGQLCIASSRSIHVIVDINGWWR